MKRRSFLQALAADGLVLAGWPASAAGLYQVGVGNSSDPYTAAQRAVSASGQWPALAISGQTVMIKPNLVAAKPSSSGATTDPQVVRALVDLALAAGAARVIVVEGSAGAAQANFEACGYGFFSSYDARVSLMDLAAQPAVLAAVPNGLAYRSLYVPAPVLEPGCVFISAGKLKCHVNAVVTLSMKNLFGLAAPAPYAVSGRLPRQDLHFRGVDESILDLNLVRPISFAVVDGIWGMEGNGPTSGTPVAMNLVFAGLNATAVDRVCLEAMEVAQNAVPHLTYAASRGLGPADTSSVTTLGDGFTPYPFVPAQTPPVLWRPKATPASISVGAGQQTTISYKTRQPCYIRAEIIVDDDATPGITVVRTLRDWASHPGGTATVPWDGKDGTGSFLPPGLYMVRVMASYGSTGKINYATAWISVTA